MIRPLLIALALVARAAPSLAAPRDHLEPFACQSRRELFDLLNAADRGDTKQEALLAARSCELIAGLHYKVVDGENGVVTIRVFAAKGDWEHSRLAYTLDDMVTTK
jgi:hypothetical protein